MRVLPRPSSHCSLLLLPVGAPWSTFLRICLSGLRKVAGQLAHRICYTTPACLSVGTRSFGFASSCLRVVLRRNETLTPSGVRIHLTALDKPCTYRSVTTGLWDWSAAGLVLVGFVWCWTGFPLVMRACLMSSVSRSLLPLPCCAVSWPLRACGPVGGGM